jgi:antitoxin CptB
MHPMTSDTVAYGSDAASIRLKRLKFRSWHRGTQEMDLLLGRFADARLKTLSEQELDLYESVLGQADQDLYAWVTGEQPWPTSLRNPLTQQITDFSQKPPAC